MMKRRAFLAAIPVVAVAAKYAPAAARTIGVDWGGKPSLTAYAYSTGSYYRVLEEQTIVNALRSMRLDAVKLEQPVFMSPSQASRYLKDIGIA